MRFERLAAPMLCLSRQKAFRFKPIAVPERRRQIAPISFSPQGQNRHSRENEMAKVAIVTGAGTGVGRAAALALMKAGYSVALAGRRKEPLDAVLKEGGGNGIAVPTDVTKVDAIQIGRAHV